MVNIESVYNILKTEVAHNLAGELLLEDAYCIRWQCDGIQNGHTQDQLEDIATDDVDLIIEVLVEENLGELIEITDPEFDDVYVYFYIQEL